MSTGRLLAALVLVLAAAAAAARAQSPRAAVPADIHVPYAIDAWEGREADPVDPEIEASLSADRIVNRTYVAADGEEAGLYIAYYAQQRPGVSIHSPLHCLPGTGWEVVSNETLDVATGDETGGTLRRLVAQKGPDRILVLYWYAIDGRMIASEARSRLQLLQNRVRLGRNDAALVRVALPITGSVVEAEHRAIRFARALAPFLRKAPQPAGARG